MKENNHATHNPTEPEHPTHPVKGGDDVNQNQVRHDNKNTHESPKDRMVENGRGENIAGRQSKG